MTENAAPARPHPAAPKIAVIVTNFNYGHFLPACLASVAAQTRRADEVIVVDDGSTDGSAAVLAGRTGITVILQPNRGQAAAFNAGFAASSADMVLFLDADDVLALEALQVAERFWSDDIAGLSWDLATIDIDGRASGHYQMRGGSGSQRHRVLKELAVEFMPTSGNVFARSAVAWAFPLPEARWKISADALLVRAAMLSGPMRHLPQTLGSYRMHGHNNYFVDGTTSTWRIRRGSADIASAGLDLVTMIDRSGPAAEFAAMRPLLLSAALRRRLVSDRNGDRQATMPGFLSRTVWLQAKRGGIGLMVLFGLARVSLPRSPRLRGWAIDRAARPAWLQALVTALKGRRTVRANAGLLTGPDCASVTETPWTVSGHDLDRLCAGPEWHWQFELPVALCRSRGSFSLRRLLAEAVFLDLDIEPPAGLGPLVVDVSLGSARLQRFSVSERQICRVILPESGAIAAPQDDIVIEVRMEKPGLWRRLKRTGQACAQLYLHSVAVTAAPKLSTGAVLPVAATVPLDHVPADALALHYRRSFVDPSQRRPGQRLLSIAPPAFSGPACLVLTIAGSQQQGWVDAWLRDNMVFSGDVGPGSICLLPIRAEETAVPGEIILSLQFRADDPLSEGALEIESLGWVANAPVSEDRQLLGFGGRISAETPDGFDRVLGAGWEVGDDGDAVMFALSAALRLALAPFESTTDPVLTLDLEPLSPPVNPFLLVVAVLVNGREAAVRNLTGSDRVDIPLRGVLNPTENAVDVEIFAGVRSVGAEAAELGAHGGLRLRELGLLAVGASGLLAGRNGGARAGSDVTLRNTLSRLEKILAADHRAAADRRSLAGMRDDILAEIDRLSPAALCGTLSPGALKSLARLGARLPVLPQAEVWPGGDATDQAAGWLRAFARRIASGPASVSLPDAGLKDFPACSAAYAGAIGICLAEEAGPELSAAELDHHRHWLCRLLDEARCAIASCDATDPRRRIAEAFLENCRPNRIVFSPGPLIDFARSFAAALETYLLARGDGLHLAATGRPDGPLRLGILLRHAGDAPETRILRALLSRLPENRFQVRIFAAEQAVPQADLPGTPPMVGLAGIPVSLAVATIRATCPDIMLVGSFFFGFDRMSLIAAHKLAARQVAFSAISPVTTGLASVDTFVLGDMVAPAGCEADYSETCIRAPGTGQIFLDAASAPEPPGDRALLRMRLGIGNDAVMLLSGTMLDQIGAPLLRAWMEILARAPKSVLVLYPFAPNWNRAFDREAFSERLQQARAEFDLPADRIRCLAAISRDKVRRLLGAADLYLDSFPCAGATTTVEALLEGLPVVALKGGTQRGHQAAGWLQAFGLEDLIAADAPGYVDLAAALALDPARRGQASERIARNRTAALQQQEFSDWLVGFLSPPAPAAPRYMFHHLPKSGGISVRKMFESWFTVVRDYREPWGPVDPPPLDLNALGPDHLLTGHYATDGVPLAARYPETADPARWRRISFLRHPLDLALSYYFFERVTRGQHDPTFRAKPLGQFLRDYPGIYLAHFECTRDNWQETLESYWFLGTLERLPDCMGWLAGNLGKPSPEVIRHDHATPRTEAPAPEDVAIFVRNMALEFEIYRWTSDRLCRILGEPPTELL